MKIKNDTDRAAFTNVWVIAEHLSGALQPVTYELIGAAKELAQKRSSQVWAIVIGAGVAAHAPSVFQYGADKVVVVDNPALTGFNDELEAKALVDLIDKYRPEIVICGATARGRALIPRVAVKSNCGLTADCTGLDIDPSNGDLLQTRPAFGGNIMATIRSSDHRPQMATVRPRVMKAPDPNPDAFGEIITEEIDIAGAGKAKRILDTVHSDEAAVNLAEAEIIIAGGRGMKGPEGFDLLRRLATRLGGAVGASRAAVDAGWIPYAHQVGQTGQTVQTKVYVACAISGQIQHLVGMQSCDLIIAIDKNPNTPMMQIADIALVGDVFEILPEIIDEIPKL